MAEYRVYLQATAEMAVRVEAEDETEAIDKAYDELPGGVCAQCSGWRQKWNLDIGDFEVSDSTDEFPNPELVSD